MMGMEFVPPYTLDEIKGRDWYVNILKQCLPNPELDRFLLLDAGQPVALCGQAGCGKRTLAAGYAGSACARGMKCILAQGSDYSGELAKAREELAQLADRKEETLIVLEGCGRETVWEALFLESEERTEDPAVHWLVVEDDTRFLSSPWAEDMLLLHVLPPDRKERELFFALEENRLMRRMDEKGEKRPSFSWLAEKTEGLTYRDLNQVIRLIRLSLKGRVIREYGGDIHLLYEQGLRTGQFFYSEKMFLEIVERVRNMRMVLMPGQTMAALPMDPSAQSPKEEKPVEHGSSGEDGGLSEDELAMQNVLSMLRLKE